MIKLPDRLAGIRAKLENGERVSADDYRQAETLIAFDVVEAGRLAAEQAAEFNELENEKCLDSLRAMAKR